MLRTDAGFGYKAKFFFRFRIVRQVFVGHKVGGVTSFSSQLVAPSSLPHVHLTEGVGGLEGKIGGLRIFKTGTGSCGSKSGLRI